MKNKVLFIVIIIGYLFAPSTIISQNIFPSNGNAGIGTTTPNKPLHIVAKDPSILLSGDTPNITFTTNPFTLTYIPAFIGITNKKGKFLPSALAGDLIVKGQANGNILFGTNFNNGATPIERMRINNNGFVGIGVTNPESKLHVNGSIRNNSFNLSNNSGDLKMRRFGAGDTVWKRALVPIYDGNTNESQLIMNFAGDFENGVRITGSKLTVDSKLGIGTSNPITNFHVASGTNVGLSGGGFITTGNTNSKSVAIDNNEIQARNNGAASTLHLQAKGGNTIIHNSRPEEERFVIKSNGQVGIGTVNTSGYKLAVNGNILTEELKIRTYANWPDYVFEENYNLKPLKELESEINTLGHLPNVPSAKEVENRGFNIGEMNAKLLEKVEELTLYTIKQQKEIEELKSIVDKLISKN